MHWHQLRILGFIKRLGLTLDKDFFCLGFVPDNDVLPIIKNSTALIMPSLSEGGGSYPIEEALNVGVPVACSEIPIFREQLRTELQKLAGLIPTIQNPY